MLISTIFISVLVLCCTECSYSTSIETHPNVKLLPNSCGDVDGARYSESIVAGLYEFPWIALISYQSRNGNQFKCSGTIINSKYILTTAHCVTNNYKIAGVRIGEIDLRSKTDCQGEEPRLVCESHIQDIRVDNIILHQNFSRPAPVNDVALIRLLTPINFEYRNALPICLPVTQELRNVSLAGMTGIIAGWGLMEANRNSPVLLKDYISINNEKDCKNLTYNNESAGGSESVLTEICVGKNHKDSCRGDGGSPLMVQGIHEGVDRYIQYGIVSRGPRECGSEPEVFTDVTKYMGWILDSIKE